MGGEDLNLQFVDEALRLVRDAGQTGIQLRILGSIAYRIQCPRNIHLFEGMARALTDVDFAGLKSQNTQIRKFMMARGYRPDEGVYVASEGSRHIYLHEETKLNVDVFADELYFCHRIPFEGRLHLDSPTISTTDLLLEKMQIVEINLKDFKDTLVLLLEHPLGTSRDSGKHIDIEYITSILSNDWGFYYTFTTNLKRVPEHLAGIPAICSHDAEAIRARVGDLIDAIERAPKSLKWRLRAKIGPRMRWYQEVSEKSAQF